MIITNITSVICYRLVLSLGTATGSALGVVTYTALIIYLLTLLILETFQEKVTGYHAVYCQQCNKDHYSIGNNHCYSCFVYLPSV